MKAGRNLTERERKYLEHVQRAYSRGQSLAQYCRDAEIDVKDCTARSNNCFAKVRCPKARANPGDPIHAVSSFRSV